MTDTAISPLRRRMMCDAVIQRLLRPTERALLLARCQGPRPLPAVLPASRPFTPVRSAPHGDEVVSSTAATERPGVAGGPNE